MQVTSIPSSPVEIEVAPAASAAAPQGTTVDFAAMLATLLSGMNAAPATATLNGVPPTDAPEEPEEDAEVGVPEATSESTPATSAADLVLASAIVATTSLPPVTLTPAPTGDATGSDASPSGAATTPVVPAANVVASAPQTTMAQTTVEVEAPLASTSVDANTAPVSPSQRPQVWVPVSVSVGDARSGTAPQEQSTATYTVQPSPARAVAIASPKHDTKQVAPNAAPVASVTPLLGELAPATTPTPQAAALGTPAVASAGIAPTPEAAAPQAAPAANVVVAANTASDTASAGGSGGDTSGEENPTGKAPKGEPAPPAAPIPVLERHAVVLARNALNEQVRGASARELLANARETEAPAERAPDTTSAQLLGTSTDHTQRGVAKATTAAEIPAAHATLPTLGEDLVKHISIRSGPGERSITLRLTPESLGDVQVEIRSTSSELSVRLISQDSGVRDALEQHAVGLRESLARDGRETRIEIGSQLNSNFGQTHEDTQSGRQAMQQDAQGRPRFGPPIAYGADTPDLASTPAERRGNPHAGVLNLFA